MAANRNCGPLDVLVRTVHIGAGQGPGPSGDRGVGRDVDPPYRVALARRNDRGAIRVEFLEPLLAADFLGKALWVWLLFIALVVALLAFDLGVLHRDQHEIEIRESLWLSAGYISVACAFGGWVWCYLGSNSGIQYFTGFLIEKSLSLDNVFVIALIFSYFAVPRQYQHRVLFWGFSASSSCAA